MSKIDFIWCDVIFIPVTRFVEKYVAGRRKRFHIRYTFLIVINVLIFLRFIAGLANFDRYWPRVEGRGTPTKR